MKTLLLIFLFSFIAFFVGRVYQFCSGLRKRYFQDWLQYQKTLLSDCLRTNRLEGRTLDAFFINRGYKNIVILGVGAQYYFDFIHDTNLDIFEKIYLADGNRDGVEKNFEEKVYSKEEVIDLEFDVIVVTSLSHFAEIDRELKALGIEKEIVAYSDLLYNAAKEV